MLDGYQLRDASNRDRDLIWGLISSVLAEYGIPTDREGSDRDLVDIETNYWNAGGAFRVLTQAENIVGTVALKRESERCVELCRMYLVPEQRGKGLGRQLFDWSVQEALRRGYTEMQLSTNAALIEAIALYRTVGFERVDMHPKCCNCDISMRKQL
jgi:GNAT superfamily N-acetyltransferase